MQPKKVISLVPSITELLFDIGLDDEVIGITKFCIYPKNWHKFKTKVGGTKNVNISLIKSLQPDLIICNKEENVKEQIEELATFCKVYVTDVKNYDDALEMIFQLGQTCWKSKNARLIFEKIQDSFSKLSKIITSIKAAYLIWYNPYMTIGNDTFIHNMMQKAGFENIFSEHTRYPYINVEILKEKNPEVILLSSEPYPFKQKHIDELQIHLPNTKIILVDGEMFSWYGSRMLQAADYFIDLQKQFTGGNLQ